MREEPETFDRGLVDEIYNVERRPLGTLPDAPLTSAQGKELHPPILSMLAMHGGQVKRERGVSSGFQYILQGEYTFKNIF